MEMEIKNIKITNRRQFEKLVQLMKDNPEIDRRKKLLGTSKEELDDKWENLTVELNRLGPPSRSAKEWQRVWIHYKAKVKKKVAINREKMLASGGGPSEQIRLNQLEESVRQLVQKTRQSTPTGHAYRLEHVEPRPLQLSAVASVIPEATNIKSLPSCRRNAEKERLQLVKEQVSRDLKFKDEIECNTTGGGKYIELQLFPMEDAVPNLKQFQGQLTPHELSHGVQDQRFSVIEGDNFSIVEYDEFSSAEESFNHHQPGNYSSSGQKRIMEANEDLADICSESSNAINSHSKTSKKSQSNKKEKKNSAEYLLELHSNMQEKVFNEISNIIDSIKNTLDDTRNIEEEKLKLLRRQNEREEELFQNEMKKKKIELEIKKRELQKLNEWNQIGIWKMS